MRCKGLSIATVMLLFFFTFSASTYAAPTVYLDGHQLTFTDTQPTIDDGRTLVPLRAIFEAMAATVTWDQNTQTATAVKGSTTVVLQIGSTSPTINGQVKQLDVPAKIVDGRTLAPLRFVGEAFGGTVDWNQANETITIASGATPQALIVANEGFMATEGSSGEVRVFATVKNPNTSFMPYRISYSFSCYDSKGKLVCTTSKGMMGSPISTIYIIPPGHEVTIHNYVYYKGPDKIAKVKLNLPGFEWKKTNHIFVPLRVSNTNLIQSDSSIKILGEVTNPLDYQINAWILITMYDSDGKPIDGGFVMVDNIGPGQTLPFSKTFFDKWGSTNYKIVAYPTTIKDWGY